MTAISFYKPERIHELAGQMLKHVEKLEDDPQVVAAALEAAAQILRGATSALVNNAFHQKLLR